MVKADHLWQPCILGPRGLSSVTKNAIDGWGPWRGTMANCSMTAPGSMVQHPIEQDYVLIDHWN